METATAHTHAHHHRCEKKNQGALPLHSARSHTHAPNTALPASRPSWSKMASPDSGSTATGAALFARVFSLAAASAAVAAAACSPPPRAPLLSHGLGL